MIVSEVVVICAATAASVMMSGISMSSTMKDPYWYDITSIRYRFEPSKTDTLDSFLAESNHASVCNKIIKSKHASIPGEGAHRYYYHPKSDRRFWNKHKNIFLLKHKENKDDDDDVKSVYTAYIFPGYEYILRQLLNDLDRMSENDVRVKSIDTSDTSPKIIEINKICKQPRLYQEDALKFILDEYTEFTDFNVKTIIYGKRGSGKTFMGRLISKRMRNCSPLLFDDFDPSTIGVNIATLILNQATKMTPVIIVINEIDVIYNKVINEDPGFDPRLQHTKDKQTFNNMLDLIESTKYCITIFTTEKNPHKFQHDHDDFKSFMRHGRLDFVINMENNIATKSILS